MSTPSYDEAARAAYKLRRESLTFTHAQKLFSALHALWSPSATPAVRTVTDRHGEADTLLFAGPERHVYCFTVYSLTSWFEYLAKHVVLHGDSAPVLRAALTACFCPDSLNHDDYTILAQYADDWHFYPAEIGHTTSDLPPACRPA